ncbi:MAG: SAM-dependent methyltransferase [Bacteroidales bacterium]|nr:SAM-dependent methyltransferase [Bacteroidales bacterium]
MARLILFPVPIGGDDLDQSLPAANHELLLGCTTFIVEEQRTALRFLKRAGYPLPIAPERLLLLNEHTPPQAIAGYLDAIKQGHDIGLLSEAGLPCVADPGALVVRQAQQQGIVVVPLVGPSSLMLALMASGLNGQQFAFNGYLPVDRQERAAAIRRLEGIALRTGSTQLLIEAPYRNNQMLESLAATCRPDTLICVACDLTQPTQTIQTHSAGEWLTLRHNLNLHKRPTVFLIGI